ncbi:hypothetical protein MMC09_004427 [Bachmanniomyces sp. S44760]|nr:hypothetical protein [Bachmanniomyces sp. S44760]
MPYYQPDGTLLKDAIAGIGRTGLVVLHHGNVIKIPQAHRDPYASSEQIEDEDFLIEMNCESLENEKEAYRRLETHEGLVSIVDISERGIEMAYMENGCLSHYLREHEPPRHLAVRWILKIAETICYVHSKCVIVGDIASRNVLLDREKSAHLCDFSDAGIMPLGSNMSQVQHYGLSAKTDVFQFGSLMYEILTRKTFHYDLLANKYVEAERLQHEGEDWDPSAIWPQLEELPSTEQFDAGRIVFKCWTGIFRDMAEVCEAIMATYFEDLECKNQP